jgi:hypothetical protein
LKKHFKSKIELGVPLIVPDLNFKYWIISLKRTKVIEHKQKLAYNDMGKS